MAIYTAKQVQDLLRQVGFPEDKIVLMTAICKQESGFRTDAVNDGSSTKSVEYSVGLFQINTRVHKKYTVEQLKNPIINVSEALRIFKTQGLRAWGGYTDGGYKKYLALSQAAYSGSPIVQKPPNSPTATDYSKYLLPEIAPVDKPDEDSTVPIVAAAIGVLILFLILKD